MNGYGVITVSKPSTNVIVLGKDDSGRITVYFQYDPLFVTKFKTVEGRKWHPEEKYWTFPNTNGTLEKIIKVFKGEEIHLDPALQAEIGSPIRQNPSLAKPSPQSPSLVKRGEGRFSDKTNPSVSLLTKGGRRKKGGSMKMNKRTNSLLWNFLSCLTFLLVCTNLSFAQNNTLKSHENIKSRIRFSYPDRYDIQEILKSDGTFFAAILSVASNSEASEWTIDICAGEGTEWIFDDTSDEATLLTSSNRPTTQVTDFATTIARLHCSSNGRSCKELDPWISFITSHGLKAYEVFLQEEGATTGPVFAVDISTSKRLRVLYIAPREKDSRVYAEDLKNIVNSVEMFKIKKSN